MAEKKLDPWDKPRDMIYEALDISKDIEKHLDAVAHLYKDLQTLISDTYVSVPKTDETLMGSPVSPAKILHFLKLHLFVKGVKVDRLPVFDPTKVKTFSENFKRGTDWLLKYQNEVR